MSDGKYFDAIASAGAERRDEVARSLYDERYEIRLGRAAGELPTRRRRKKIALYQAIIGRGHGAILEIGCGQGDLAYALVDQANRIVGTDIAVKGIELAKRRQKLWSLSEAQGRKMEFVPMSAVRLEFPDATFDWAVSTSMIEHLHPDDVQVHLREVHRVLKAGGRYLMWCPNRLGHHRDWDGHLSMLSYGEWMEKLREAGFLTFRSTLTSRLPMVDARFKVFLEKWLAHLKIKIMWTHLGVRNVLLVAGK